MSFVHHPNYRSLREQQSNQTIEYEKIKTIRKLSKLKTNKQTKKQTGQEVFIGEIYLTLKKKKKKKSETLSYCALWNRLYPEIYQSLLHRTQHLVSPPTLEV